MATVGHLSHPEFWSRQFGSANMHRRFGYKPSSGLWHKKTGYDGRKIRPLPPVRVLDKPKEEPPRHKQFTLTKEQCCAAYGTAATHPLVSSAQYYF